MWSFLTVALGGALGAMARYGSGLVAARFTEAAGLYATFFVNIVGSALMGIVMGWLTIREQSATTDALYLLLAVGFLGGFTTFSAFSLEVVHLVSNGRSAAGAAYAIASVVGGAVALIAALYLTRRLMA